MVALATTIAITTGDNPTLGRAIGMTMTRKRGYAHEIRCVHTRARVYHVHHKPLYFLIAEGSSRYGRAVSPRVAVERLMLLDAVLDVGDVEWLTTAAEKGAYLEGLKAKATDDRPQEPTSDDARPRPSPPPICRSP